MAEPMKDRQGRVIDYLRLSLTSECNLRCLYCLPAVRGILNSSLALDDFAFIVRAAARLGITRVRLTGGEPLLVPGLGDFIKDIKRINGISDVALTTNAQRLAAHIDELSRAGISRLNVSLDSLKPERYAYLTRGGKLEPALAGIEAALSAGMSPVKVNCVVIGGVNDDEIEAFALWTKHKPINVRFIELMPFGEAAKWEPHSFVPVRTIKERLSSLGLTHTTVLGGGPAENYVINKGVGTVGFISGTSEHFCGSCNRLRITCLGSIRPCLFADVEYSIIDAVKSRDIDLLVDLMVSAADHKPERQSTIVSKRMAEIGG